MSISPHNIARRCGYDIIGEYRCLFDLDFGALALQQYPSYRDGHVHAVRPILYTKYSTYQYCISLNCPCSRPRGRPDLDFRLGQAPTCCPQLGPPTRPKYHPLFVIRPAIPPSTYDPLPAMPLDSSAYALARLRVDGRRWNELRRIHGQMSPQASADGSSYFEMGNTKVICTILGPRQQPRAGARDQGREATIDVDISIAGFSGMDRKKRSRTDK